MDIVIGSFLIAVKALNANKLRTCLTMLGMIIGVAAVMTMVALGNGAQASVEEEMRSAGTNLIYISAGNYTRGGDSIKVASGLGAAKTLRLEDGDAIARSVRGIKAWAPGVRDRAPMAVGRTAYFGPVVGTSPELAPIYSWSFRRGGMFERGQVDTAANVAVLGTLAAERLFGAGVDPVGQAFTIRLQTFTVVGVTDSKVEDQPESVFIPVTALQRLRRVEHLDTITVAAVQAGEASRIAAEAGAALRIRHRIGRGDGKETPGIPDDFTIRTEAAKALTKGLYTSAAVFVLANLPQLDQITLEEMAGTLQQTSRTLTALLASIAAISLIVGGIGIMNIMLVSVTERTREIGLRMAMGARSRDVLVQFLVEAITLSLAGGCLGIVLGFAASAITTRLLDWRTSMSFGAVALAFGTALAVGVFFGFYPARRASALDPIDALRFE
jgi:ABC-type antimicrobial peptide transport system permease subunit